MQTTQILADAREKLFELADSIKLPATFADPDLPDCPLIHCNPAFEALTGYKCADVVGKNCRFLQGSDIDQAERLKLKQATSQRRYCTAVLSNCRADGTQFNNFLFIEPISLGQGKQIMMGCQHEFRDFQSQSEISEGSQKVLSRHDEMRSYFIDSKTVFLEALQMRSETAVLMVKNYLLRRGSEQRTFSGDSG